MKSMRLFLALLLTIPSVLAAQDLQPSTIANDASCDIAVQPAATLLVPYFEVDSTAPITTAKTTLFTVTNTSRIPAIANVTVWTNLDHPVLSFPLFLTGYDVQAINVYELLVRGQIAPILGTSNATTPGSRSLANTANPGFLPSVATTCARGAIPINLPEALARDIRATFTTGRVAGCAQAVALPRGGLLTGYITVDVVATCSSKNPLDPTYWDELLYDNVLIGDFELIAPNPTTGNYAEGNPMVHIRAVPEGGAAGSRIESPLPFTFYDRLTPAGRRRTDRRQPLPSTFTARFIEGGATAFDTELVIWREGSTGSEGRCGDEATNTTEVAELVRFDERENPTVRIENDQRFAVADSVRTATSLFPPSTGEVGGWLYLNLNNGGSTSYSVSPRYDLASDSSTVRGERQSQAWVTSRFTAEGRYAVAFDATSLGNGCSPAPASPALATMDATVRAIGPARDRPGDVLPAGNVTHRNDDSCDIATLPAATLLIPYFEVGIDEPAITAPTTLVTVVNTTNRPQIARMTIWTDWAYALMTFDVFLTGYDVQAINLYDVLVTGRLPGGGSRGMNGARSLTDNPRLLPSAAASCAALPDSIPPALQAEIRSALTLGVLPSTCGSNPVGGKHAKAVGYITIDVVATCSGKAPDAAGAIDELLFDNVLTGDYELVYPNQTIGNFAMGSPAVHIRAIPEGGNAGETLSTRLPRTFYDRFYGGNQHDRRQPLPSAFAARYIQGGNSGFLTDFAVWVGATAPADAACARYFENSRNQVVEFYRFDERENPTTLFPQIIFEGLPVDWKMPATSLTRSSSDIYPPLQSGDVAGWMYFNLARRDPDGPNQAWVVTTMSAEGRYAVAFDAAALGNGCSAPHPRADSHPIAPAPPEN